MRGQFKIYGETTSPNSGGEFQLYVDPESPNERACLGCVLKRNRQMRGVCKIYDEPEPPNEGASFRYIYIYI